MKWRDARISHFEQASSSVPKVKDTDWREKTSQSKGQSFDWSWKFIVHWRQDEKYRRVIIDNIPCVVDTSLETDAFVAIVAHSDMLMVTRKPIASSKKVSRGSVVCLKEEKVQGCVSQNSVPINSILRKVQELQFNASARHTRKFSGCTWNETEFVFFLNKGSLEALSKKVNFIREILARMVLRDNHLRKPHDKQIVSSK